MYKRLNFSDRLAHFSFEALLLTPDVLKSFTVTFFFCVCFYMLPPIIAFYSPASIKELKEEMRVLQEYLDTANDQIQVGKVVFVKTMLEPLLFLRSMAFDLNLVIFIMQKKNPCGFSDYFRVLMYENSELLAVK